MYNILCIYVHNINKRLHISCLVDVDFERREALYAKYLYVYLNGYNTSFV